MNNNYELHPLCTLFPRMAGQEFQSLVDDIKANGLREPIIIHEGMILDGGNRYRACIEAGIDPEFMEFGGTNLVSYVLSANLHRRHMTPGQQAAIVASAQDWSKANGRGGDRKSDQSSLNDFDTVEKRAAIAGVHRDTQIKADKVAKADPELSKKVAKGEISLPEAVKSITPKKTKPEDSEKPEFDESELMAEMAGEINLSDELENAHKEIDRLNKIIESDDQLATAMAENKRLTELCRVIEERARGYQSSENAAVRKAKMWKEKFEKLERQVKAAGLVEF